MAGGFVFVLRAIRLPSIQTDGRIMRATSWIGARERLSGTLCMAA
jgi:hypothetical protein